MRHWGRMSWATIQFLKPLLFDYVFFTGGHPQKFEIHSWNAIFFFLALGNTQTTGLAGRVGWTTLHELDDDMTGCRSGYGCTMGFAYLISYGRLRGID
jgi:hypothetical protein